MKDKFEEHIHRAGDSVRLRSDERERMRETLQAYIRMKPVRTDAPQHNDAFFGWFNIRSISFRPTMAVAVLVAFLSSTGISFAAEKALPGDALYSVKTRINEPLRGIFALSSEAKAEWAIDVAGERMREATALAAQGALSTTTQEELRASFEGHIQTALASAFDENTANPNKGADLAVRLEAQVSEYQNVLSGIAESFDMDIHPLADSLQTQHEKIAEARARAEAIVDEHDKDPARTLQKLRDMALRQIDDSAHLARRASSALTPSSSELIAKQLAEARHNVVSGETFASKRSDDDAKESFRSAVSASERVRTFLTTNASVHARTGLFLDKRETEDQDDTDDERGPDDTGRDRDGDGASDTEGAATTTDQGAMRIEEGVRADGSIDSDATSTAPVSSPFEDTPPANSEQDDKKWGFPNVLNLLPSL